MPSIGASVLFVFACMGGSSQKERCDIRSAKKKSSTRISSRERTGYMKKGDRKTERLRCWRDVVFEHGYENGSGIWLR